MRLRLPVLVQNCSKTETTNESSIFSVRAATTIRMKGSDFRRERRQFPVNRCFRCGHRWVQRGLSRSTRCPKCTSPEWHQRPPSKVLIRELTAELFILEEGEEDLVSERNTVTLGPTEIIPLQALLDYAERRLQRKALIEKLFLLTGNKRRLPETARPTPGCRKKTSTSKRSRKTTS
jgi:predicted Zn-ribbon and HTH transcriptional regulator